MALPSASHSGPASDQQSGYEEHQVHKDEMVLTDDVSPLVPDEALQEAPLPEPLPEPLREPAQEPAQETCLPLQEKDVNKQSTWQLVQFEYHIVYSMSYEVPVLYFKATRANGSCLDVETIWQNIPRVLLPPKYTQGQVAATTAGAVTATATAAQAVAQEQVTTAAAGTSIEGQHEMTGHSLFGDVITQVDHPFLAVPFFMLHPCATRHLLSQVHTSKVARKKEEEKCPHSDTSASESQGTLDAREREDRKDEEKKMMKKKEGEQEGERASPQLQFARRQSERGKNEQSIDLPSSSSSYTGKCFKHEANSSDTNIKESVLSASTSSSAHCNKYNRSKRSILLSWLSSVAPIVGLKIDPAYARKL